MYLSFFVLQKCDDLNVPLSTSVLVLLVRFFNLAAAAAATGPAMLAMSETFALLVVAAAADRVVRVVRRSVDEGPAPALCIV